MKRTSESGVMPKVPTVERRSFLWKAGAALSATLASAAATASAGAPRAAGDTPRNSEGEIARLSNELARLEDANAIRKLHLEFGRALTERRYEVLVRLFASDGDVDFGPAHSALLGHAHEQDVVDVSADRQTARATFHCLVQAQAELVSNAPLVQMARQQGQGIRQWWEHGVYESAFVKTDGVWKIRQLRYRATGPSPISPG